MVRTFISAKFKTTSYNTRHMRVDLLKRMRRLSLRTGREQTIDMILNSALEIGIRIMERGQRGAKSQEAA